MKTRIYAAPVVKGLKTTKVLLSCESLKGDLSPLIWYE